ncbi:ribonuclease HIII [Tumebacillus sp. BK434]|uniref:ribonuclease HIII n=1 Tax=Tumebacillus sp. BK434 TaxID=2512169 RepID=UPI0010DD1F44|nr:ribonuclease HIII [Tumebacillus sp. BK434]TCP53929.1 ribonuclease HIII [Tumebacillus sp. BK434]
MVPHNLATACEQTEALCVAHGLEILEQKEIPYGRQFKVRKGSTTAQLNVYFGKKGLKLVSQGGENAAKAALEDLMAEMQGGAPAAAKAVKAAKPAKQHPEVVVSYDEPWIGTDESGKGDFFGGLVTAGVIVDPEAVPLLQSLGVDDSKKITDAKIPGLAAEIKKICYGRYKVLHLKPAKYNELYEKFQSQGKNLNFLLSWAHSSVIEKLVEIQSVKLVVVDKFANETLIENRLKKLDPTIQLVLVPKAEQNLAVAAASILARDAFLRWHKEVKAELGIEFPKGASSLVIKAGRAFVQAKGTEALREVSKLHFKTTEDIQQKCR